MKVVFITLLIVGIMYCSANDLRLVKERIRYLENRVNSESKFRNEDYSEIIYRLDEIDKVLNTSLDRRVSRYNEAPKEIGETSSKAFEHLKEDFTRIRKAFGEEKTEAARIRREIPNLGYNLKAVQEEVDNYCKISLNKTDNAIAGIEETRQMIVSELSKKHIALLNEMNANSLHDSQYLKDITSKLEQVKNNTNEIETKSFIDSKRNDVMAANVERNKLNIERVYSLVTELLTNMKPLLRQVSSIAETSELIVSDVTKKHITLLNEINENSAHDSQYLQDITSKLELLKNNTDEIETISVKDSKRNDVMTATVERNKANIECVNSLVTELSTNIKILLRQVSSIKETRELIESEISKKHKTLLNEMNRNSSHDRQLLRDIAIKLEQVKKKTDDNENSKRVDSIAATVQINKDNIERVYSLVTEISTLIKQRSCNELFHNGITQSGTYTLRQGPMVYCDQTTDGGGWIVFQRRLNGEVDFYRNWTEYKNGFGNLNGEFWLGNEHLSLLTAGGEHELRIELEDFDGNSVYAKYSKFKIYPEEFNYKLEVSGYSGTAVDALDYHNDMMFTTFDRDNDKTSYNCAVDTHGAWWYDRCYRSNLNGKYYNAPRIRSEAIIWYNKSPTYLTAKKVEMKFR